jgi:hypothetical protein
MLGSRKIRGYDRPGTWLRQSQGQSHITTDEQSVSKSWFRAPSGAHDQMLITV